MCEERDGQFFTAEDLPLDHPNGMCTMEPDIDMHEALKDLTTWEELSEFDKFFEDLDFRPDMD